MPDATTNPPPAPDSAPPSAQAADPAPPPVPAQPVNSPASPTPAEVKVFDADYVKSLRDEAAQSRVAARDTQKLYDQEKARATEADARAARIERERAVEKAGVADSDAALKLLGDDANCSLAELPAKLDELLKKYPWLKGQADTAAANAQRSGAKTLEEQVNELFAQNKTGVRV